MFGNIWGTLGKGLLGSGGGILSSLLGGNSGGGTSGNTSSSGGLGGIFRTLAPIAGTALGTLFGGPAGGALGGTLAGSLGDSLFGGGSSQQPQQQAYGPQQSYGNQFGTSMGNTLNQGFNQYMPQQIQGQTFGNMGGALGSYFGNKFGMGDVGSAIGNAINPYIQKYMPESMRDVQMGNFGGYLGSQAGQRIDSGFQSRGFNPYSTPSYGNQGQGQLPDYSQSYGGIPEAPAIGDLYNRAPGGSMGGSSFGGGYNPPMLESPRPYSMQPQPGRSALMNDIRNYRGNAPQQQMGYGSIPEAPPIGDLYGNAPGNSGGYGIRAGVSRSPSSDIFSEFRNRASQPGMGLRPTQMRAPSAYPSSGGDGMMDLLRSRLGDIRGAVAPNEFSRNYTVRGV